MILLLSLNSGKSDGQATTNHAKIQSNCRLRPCITLSVMGFTVAASNTLIFL